MSEQKEYVCVNCDGRFNADPAAEKIFCVHCGAFQAERVEPKLSFDEHMSKLLTDYVQLTDGEERRLFLERNLSQQTPEQTDMNRLRQMQDLWSMRYRKSPIKEMRWADNWLGELQTWLTFSRTSNPKSHQRKGVRSLEQFFNNKKLLKALEIARIPHSLPTDRSDPAYEPAYTLYYELLNLIYLYVGLCMKDKNYGSIILGIGRKKDSTIASKISDDFVEFQMNLLSQGPDGKEGHGILIKALLDGYRMYFDKSFTLEY